MNSLAFHSYAIPHSKGRGRALGIFIASTPHDDAEFDTELVAFASTGAAPADAIQLIGHAGELSTVTQWLSRPGDVSAARLASLTGSNSQPLQLVSFDTASGKHVVGDLSGKLSAQPEMIAAIRQGTLQEAFVRAGGLQRAPTGTHYVKTSDSHSDRFLRTSNVLESSKNVQLVAFWLLPHIWKTSAQHIVVDTSGLFGAVYCASHAAFRMGGLERIPRIWSHRSHDGVDQITPHVARSSLFVISASTSGGLAERIIARGAAPHRVLTVYSASTEQASGELLCNLLGDLTRPLESIENYSETNCPFCAKRFHRIRIQGDQFAVEPPAVTAVTISAKDLPTPLKSQLSALAGMNVFRAYMRADTGSVRMLGLNVLPILAAPLNAKSGALLTEKRAEWDAMKRRSSNLALTRIVTGTYPGSREIAEDILSASCPLMPADRQPALVPSDGLTTVSPTPGASAIVVSAVVDSPREFLAVSRSLRDAQPDGGISYLSVVDALRSKQDSDGLRLNITFGRYGSQTFSWFNLFSFPIDCLTERPSWVDELEELQRLRDWADLEDMEIPDQIEARIERLRQAPSAGMIDDLFWPDLSGTPLRLRSDFTLLHDSLRAPVASQADLFAVALMVLTQLRNESDVSRRLAHNAYQRSVLSPQNFARFSDGVLQACLLRAARPHELAFAACDETLSEQMLDILLDMLPGPGAAEKTEALPEFLVALITTRLSLHASHLRAFIDSLALKDEALGDTGRLLRRYLTRKYVSAG